MQAEKELQDYSKCLYFCVNVANSPAACYQNRRGSGSQASYRKQADGKKVHADGVFPPPDGQTESGRRFVGFSSPQVRSETGTVPLHLQYASSTPPVYLQCSATYRRRTGSEVGTSVQRRRSDGEAKRKGAGCGYGNRPPHLPNGPSFLNEAVYIRPLKGENGRLRHQSPLPVHQLYSFPFA